MIITELLLLYGVPGCTYCVWAGIRLLGWNEAGSELSDCVPDTPARMVEIETKIGHTEVSHHPLSLILLVHLGLCTRKIIFPPRSL